MASPAQQWLHGVLPHARSSARHLATRTSPAWRPESLCHRTISKQSCRSHLQKRSYAAKRQQAVQRTPVAQRASTRKPASRADPLPRATATPHSDFPVDPTNGYAVKLSRNPTDTLLFVSTQNPWWQVGRAMLGGLGICIALDWGYHTVVAPPPGLPYITQVMQTVPTIFILAASYFVLPRGGGPVGSIKAQSVAGGLKLLIEGRPGPRIGSFELWGPRRIECKVSDVKIKQSILHNQLPATVVERRQMWEKQIRENEGVGIMKRIPKATKEWFQHNALKEKNLGIEVQKKRWELDVRGGWMLDNGVALERLLRPHSS